MQAAPWPAAPAYPARRAATALHGMLRAPAGPYQLQGGQLRLQLLGSRAPAGRRRRRRCIVRASQQRRAQPAVRRPAQPFHEHLAGHAATAVFQGMEHFKHFEWQRLRLAVLTRCPATSPGCSPDLPRIKRASMPAASTNRARASATSRGDCFQNKHASTAHGSADAAVSAQARKPRSRLQHEEACERSTSKKPTPCRRGMRTCRPLRPPRSRSSSAAAAAPDAAASAPRQRSTAASPAGSCARARASCLVDCAPRGAHNAQNADDGPFAAKHSLRP